MDRNRIRFIDSVTETANQFGAGQFHLFCSNGWKSIKELFSDTPLSSSFLHNNNLSRNMATWIFLSKKLCRVPGTDTGTYLIDSNPAGGTVTIP